ncbi:MULTISPECIES: GDP-mannose 4,6-dehydratase [unclassified Sphingomonas]|uniref:GDP-mannose 4,6-dehydratase n=1 Tax=unclassified Sphingomonas TaxID=196159 RepID=UPI0006F5324F|nr:MULTISPECIES: GDP-mannose 4,6-dehydratase [unclassified Sphingomonas]KQX26166.1 GDP-mannose 4,6 dehydratase [Sphingomonas sp. Root1294]KQY69234.1 GDP-mannose 4,6 dehydratase [Sphingomonas sp. Root50]KRB89488.1 GDP-mannose 4,6 dehydratase [Sphingomonas sp. Root720]
MKIAFITGITGQDGSYLTELLLGKGYMVHGVLRRSSVIDRQRIDHLTRDQSIYNKRLFLHYCDLDDITTLRRLLREVQPREFYHLAGQSHVGLSFDIPESTCEFTAMATLRILEVLRDLDPVPRFLTTGSSEIFGAPDISPQDERTAMRPTSPYGVAKSFAVNITRVYREAFGLFACTAICYNHESERRNPNFVTRKISRAAAAIAAGSREKLALGNLDVWRDWGYAPEYVDAMWRMLQLDHPQDLVIATGITTSLKDFLDVAFLHVGLDWREHVEIDCRFIRPREPQHLVGNPARAHAILDWRAKTGSADLARLMVDADCARLGHVQPRALD